MDAVRWGIIGVGDVTEVKSGPALQQADRSALKVRENWKGRRQQSNVHWVAKSPARRTC